MTPHSDHEALKIIVSDSRILRNKIEISPFSARQYQSCVSYVFGSAADKTMQMYAAILGSWTRLWAVFFWQLLTSVILHVRDGRVRWNKDRL